ncbi:MAG TPA: arabinogalactan endo-1,4-beta-galactosidase [Ruminococcus sp.]|nr:arabinogalactan endo-1,4-beta-galactosidase [Ruminococcus sp.]
MVSVNQSGFYAIAVVVAGTDEEYQSSVLRGITKAAKEHQFNVSVFASFGGVLSNSQYDTGEYNIYRLPDFSRFDGAVLLTNTIGDRDVRQQIHDAVRASGIPAVTLDNNDCPEFFNVCIDNYASMKAVTAHILDVHHAKTLCFISGPEDNPEARERKRAFLDAVQAHGIAPEQYSIYQGDFRPLSGMRAAEALLRSGRALPDAIIAANDAMALEAASVLEEHDIRVPEDVIVTGFDYTYYAQHHCPSLTSVARPLCDAGYSACTLLLRVLAGEKCEKMMTLGAKPVFAESCGCVDTESLDIRRYRKATYGLIKNTRTDVSLLNRMTSALAVSESPEENIRIISGYLQEIACEQCCICLCDNWESAFLDGHAGESVEQYQIVGYSEEMSAPLIWSDGRIAERNRFKTAELFPFPPETGGHVSYFFPLHFRERCLGYYIFTNTEFPVRSILCHSLMMNISNSFENVRKLLHMNHAIRELDRLYVIDPLCGIFNRNGFIRLADQIFRHSCETHGSLMISFIDMDGLKYVNDNFGHDEGDFALRQLAAVIRDSCTEQQICARFGGDEFIMIADGMTEEDAKSFEQRFRLKLAEANKIISKPYELCASIGTFVTAVEPEMKLFSLIAQADQIMYEQKKRKTTSRYLRRN